MIFVKGRISVNTKARQRMHNPAQPGKSICHVVRGIGTVRPPARFSVRGVIYPFCWLSWLRRTMVEFVGLLSGSAGQLHNEKMRQRPSLSSRRMEEPQASHEDMFLPLALLYDLR